jgi:two-component SAPR family response regulator
MKLKSILPLIIVSLIIFSCNNPKNSESFIKKTTGRYLYNSDELIEVYFKENVLYLKWKGATEIKPLKINDDTFFVKEMNEKIQFLTNPSDKKEYIVLVPKEKGKAIIYNYKKLEENEKIPGEYLKNSEYSKALQGYLAIQKKDSLDSAIKESDFNSFGYKELRNKNFEKAIQIFSINVALYPNSSNVYDSLGEAYMKSGDTINAINNYKKSLALDSENKRAKRNIKRLEKK